jgi:phage terminase Nu1 subunit (DNA packaging protein)
MALHLKPREVDQRATVLTKAVLQAATLLRVTNKELAEIIGVSPSFVSNLKSGVAVLAMESKPAELAAHFIRAYRSLDAIVGGDEETATAWLRHENNALGAAPLHYMKSVYGLIDTVSYLDQRRAPL